MAYRSRDLVNFQKWPLVLVFLEVIFGPTTITQIYHHCCKVLIGMVSPFRSHPDKPVAVIVVISVNSGMLSTEEGFLFRARYPL